MVVPSPALTLVVLRCADVERARAFYEALGLAMVAEQHGSGLRHYSCTLSGGAVLEVYPAGDHSTHGVRLGLSVADVRAAVAAVPAAGGQVLRFDPEAAPASALVIDPDGHKVELTQLERVPGIS